MQKIVRNQTSIAQIIIVPENNKLTFWYRYMGLKTAKISNYRLVNKVFWAHKHLDNHFERATRATAFLFGDTY
jgi:hypothetical protein